MYTATLLVMRADNPVADTPARWRAGEIVDVFPWPGPHSNSPRHLHVHITGIPDEIPFDVLKERITQMHELVPPSDINKRSTYTARRNVVADISGLPPNLRNALLRDGSLSVPWAAFRVYMRLRTSQGLGLGNPIADEDLVGG